MNRAYIMASGDHFAICEKAVKSLCKYSECEVLLNVFDFDQAKRDRLEQACPDQIRWFDIPLSEWNNQRMTCKIRRVQKMPFEEGVPREGI